MAAPVVAEPSPPVESAAEVARRLADLRFVFEIDQERRIAFLSPDLDAAVGDSVRAAVGRPWGEVAAELGLDPAGAVAAALRGVTGWSGLAISWPLPDGARAPLSLSALPVFDRGRTFMGFRGLGLVVAPPEDTPAVDAAPDAVEFPEPAPVLEEPATEPAADEPEPAAEVPVPNALPTPDVTPEPADPAPEPVGDDAPRAAFASGNVVPLWEGVAADGGSRSLSHAEENAFDEIARRLRSFGGATDARAIWDDIAEDAGLAAPAAAPAADPVAEDLLRLLDRL
ncbi:hypothetical protein ACFQ4O_17890, partial [Methylopila musalis]